MAPLLGACQTDFLSPPVFEVRCCTWSLTGTTRSPTGSTGHHPPSHSKRIFFFFFIPRSTFHVFNNILLFFFLKKKKNLPRLKQRLFIQSLLFTPSTLSLSLSLSFFNSKTQVEPDISCMV